MLVKSQSLQHYSSTASKCKLRDDIDLQAANSVRRMTKAALIARHSKLFPRRPRVPSLRLSVGRRNGKTLSPEGNGQESLDNCLNGERISRRRKKMDIVCAPSRSIETQQRPFHLLCAPLAKQNVKSCFVHHLF